MIITGFGSLAGRFIIKHINQEKIIIGLLGSLAFIPIITVIAMHVLSQLLFLPGLSPSISLTFYFTIIVLSPFCFISGILFTLITNKESKKDSILIGRIYALESTGSLIGGLILNFLLIWYLSTFQGLYVLMFMVSVVTIYYSIKFSYLFTSGIIVFIFILFTTLFFTNDLEKSVRALSFPNQTIQYIDETPYGLIVITKQDGQLNYYENNVLVGTSDNAVYFEESVHFPMVQHPSAENVLVLSGMISDIFSELLKYSVKKIDYIDINPGFIRLAENQINFDTPISINLIEKDPVRYLKSTSELYDVVLIYLPIPSTIQINRYFTVEFFSLLKKHLKAGAIICLSAPSSENYINKEAANLLSIIVNTLKSQFKNSLVLTGTRDFIIASDRKLSSNIIRQISSLKIENNYVNAYYINDELLNDRSNKITNKLDSLAPINKDFAPAAYQSAIKLWLKYINFNYWLPAILILAFSLYFYIKSDILNKAVFAAGFAGTSIEILLLLVFQVLYGYAYFAVGVFFMIFMGGLAVGSWFWPKVFKFKSIKVIKVLLLIILIFVVILPVFFTLFKNKLVPDYLLFSVFIVILFSIAVITGAIYSVSTFLGKKEINLIVSSAYSLDLIGSAAGALLLSIYLVPFFGFNGSLIGTGFVCLLTFLLILKKS